MENEEVKVDEGQPEEAVVDETAKEEEKVEGEE